MITENNRSVFHCEHCTKFLANVFARTQGPPGDERIIAVYGDCKKHGRVQSYTNWDYEEFFPEPEDDLARLPTQQKPNAEEMEKA